MSAVADGRGGVGPPAVPSCAERRKPTAVALIDGEHYPPVVIDALKQLGDRFAFVAAVFLGGYEKIKSDDLTAAARDIYGLPVHFPTTGEAGPALAAVLAEYRPSTVVDLSDEPVVGYRERFRLVSHTLAQGVAYEGSDFRFSPPRLQYRAAYPSMSVVGTAKRVGKTALSGFVARTLQEHIAGAVTASTDRESGGVVVVAMGRGGPPEPEVIEGAGRVLEAGDLLEWSRAGRHAASDHFEDAALSRVTTVGCRRCGGGMAGEPFVSNVVAGAELAAGFAPALAIFEGSGAALPPIATDARLLVAGAHQPAEYVTGYLGAYRVLVSDAVVLTMAEEPLSDRDVVAALTRDVRALKDVPVVPVVFRPKPMEPVAGRKVALFTTAPASQERVLTRYLEERWECRVVSFSGRLSDRKGLREDVAAAEAAGSEVMLTEIKAAAIDVVAEEAERRGIPTVFVDNIPIEVETSDEGRLAALCRDLAHLAIERHGAR